MSHFLRLMSEADKAQALADVCTRLRQGLDDFRHFKVEPESFERVPGSPFAYWVSEAIREAFQVHSSFENCSRMARQGGVNGDDFRWLRLWYEASASVASYCQLVPIAKGGNFSTFYSDLHLVARWDCMRNTFFSFDGLPHRPSLQPASFDFYFRPGLTWPRRTNGLSFRVMPVGCIFADKGPAAFVVNDDFEGLLALCSLFNSAAFGMLVSVQLARTELAQSFEVGLIQQTPLPNLSAEKKAILGALARRAWSLKRTLDTKIETSHAFLLPVALRTRQGDFDPLSIEAELVEIQAEIDSIAFDLYGFSESDRQAALGQGSGDLATNDRVEDEDTDDAEPEVPPIDALLSWAVGVAFGRFDSRLATGERVKPAEPDPFDPLPAKSPGMLPDGAAPFHGYAGILVDDQGNQHDLARLVEEVLNRVKVSVPDDVRRWVQKDFFAFHLQRYSKSRRKAPIYWPLSTGSGSYTLWIYYPSLNNQTLFTAVNDFLDGPNGKLTQVSRECAELRVKGSGRSRDEEKQYETLQTFAQELTDLRDALLKIAPTYQPNHDDGVQITAAPLWQLFRHKPWQKVLKDTWIKLEKGDYDWAHLALAYWPERVREKCKTDKSLAIAQGLEDLYVEPEAAPKKMRGKKKIGGEE